MKNFKIKALIDVIVLGALLFGSSALAATSATVSATVTLQNVSVSVTDGSVSYGILAANTTKTTLATGGLNDQQTATNAGNVAEDFNIKGSDSLNWTLQASAGSDQYVHKFCTATCGTDSSPTNFTALTTSYATLGTNIATSGTKPFDLLINTPTSSTYFSSQSVDVTVQAVAH